MIKMNRAAIILIITIIATCFLNGCGGSGGENIATVSGTVTDSQGDPVEGALVGVKSSTQATADAHFYTVTDANGNYALDLNVTGTWYVAAWKEGWLPTADAVFTSSGDNDLQLLQLADNLSLSDVGRMVLAWASSVESDAAEFEGDKAADNSMDTRWSSQQVTGDGDESWYIDLDTSGTTHSVGGVTIYWELSRPYQYTVEYTTDDPSAAPTWTEIYSSPSTTGDVGGYMTSDSHYVDPIRFTLPVEARGIRIHCTVRRGNGYSAWEIKIHSAT